MLHLWEPATLLKLTLLHGFLSNSSTIPQIPSKIHIQKQDREDEVISILNLISENELNLVLKSVMDTINLFDVIKGKPFTINYFVFLKRNFSLLSKYWPINLSPQTNL